MRDIPLKSMEQIMKSSIYLRVSEEAKIELKKIVENRFDLIVEKAISFARHAKRNTLMKEDIELAIKEIND